jgi:hypothetical protein
MAKQAEKYQLDGDAKAPAKNLVFADLVAPRSAASHQMSAAD